MTQTIYGRTEGLKKQVLTQLEAIYELRADEGQLIIKVPIDKFQFAEYNEPKVPTKFY